MLSLNPMPSLQTPVRLGLSSNPSKRWDRGCAKGAGPGPSLRSSKPLSPKAPKTPRHSQSRSFESGTPGKPNTSQKIAIPQTVMRHFDAQMQRKRARNEREGERERTNLAGQERLEAPLAEVPGHAKPTASGLRDYIRVWLRPANTSGG